MLLFTISVTMDSGILQTIIVEYKNQLNAGIPELFTSN